MKISGFDEYTSEIIIRAFEDFKKEYEKISRNQFSYEAFTNHINSRQSDYGLIAYKWHEDEARLEANNNGAKAVSTFKALLSLSNAYPSSFVKDENGNIIKYINKKGKNRFEFI